MQLLDSDQELYKNFPLVISERWQQEVAETVYEAVNCDTDKNEARKRAKNKQQVHEEGTATRRVRRLIDISGVEEEEEEEEVGGGGAGDTSLREAIAREG